METLEKKKVSLKNIFMRFASVVDKGDNKGANILMFKEKSTEKVEDEKPKGGNVMTKTFEEIVKALPEDEQVIVTAEIEKVKAEAEVKPIEPVVEKGTDPDELVKSADPKLQEMIKTIKESNEKLEKESEAKDAEIKKFQDDLKKESIEKTVSTFDRIASPKEDMVALYSKLDSETEGLVTKIMKSVNEQLTAANIVKVIGSDSEGEQKSAEEIVEKEAKELMSKDSNLTLAQAKVKVIKTKPELYKQYQDEQKGV